MQPVQANQKPARLSGHLRRQTASSCSLWEWWLCGGHLSRWDRARAWQRCPGLQAFVETVHQLARSPQACGGPPPANGAPDKPEVGAAGTPALGALNDGAPGMEVPPHDGVGADGVGAAVGPGVVCAGPGPEAPLDSDRLARRRGNEWRAPPPAGTFDA